MQSYRKEEKVGEIACPIPTGPVAKGWNGQNWRNNENRPRLVYAINGEISSQSLLTPVLIWKHSYAEEQIIFQYIMFVSIV